MVSAQRRSAGATGVGAAVVVLVIAVTAALPDGDDSDPERCRAVTRSNAPSLVTLAGAAACGDAVDGRTGVVGYLEDGPCFVLHSRGEGAEPALLVWPDGSRPVAGRGPTVFVPDRSDGGDLRGGTVAVGDRITGAGLDLGGDHVDRVPAGCRRAVGDRVIAMTRLRQVRP